MAKRHKVEVVTSALGAATVYTPVLSGRLAHIQYVKGDFANGVDFTITSEATGMSLWTDTDVNASELVSPRTPTHDQAGAASLYAATGEPVEDQFVLAADRVKIVIADGGDTKSGTFHIVME
jgi:hypothetical protein